MKNIEVLAPVGSFEALEASVQNGADAVYLSGESFGARKNAKNFTREEIKEAVEYAHIRNVSVYITVNILIKDIEFKELRSYIDCLYLADVDAVIVQDLGVANYIKSHYPDLDLHASTQMSAHSFEDVKFLSEFGFKRVVVAREMSISEISKIVKNIDIEVEVFVHGALCISYSGQCLMSSMIGGRSGNRGKCAQPCRQKYELNEDGDERYLISPKDLSTIDDVSRLINMGVAAIKIEGRTKRPEYAAVVVNQYRNVVDAFKGGTIEEFDFQTASGKLHSIFNRSFTKGFVFDDKKIVASDAAGNRGVRIGTVASYNPKEEKLSIRLEKRLNKGDEIQIRRGTDNIGARTDVFYLESKRVNKYELTDIVQVDFKHDAKVGEIIFRTYDSELMQEAKQSYLKEFRKSNIKMTLEVKLREPLKLTVIDDLGNEVVKVSERIVETALNKALDKDRIEKQLTKLGSTSYSASDCNIILDEGVSVPISEINNLRRAVLEEINELRKVRYSRTGQLDFIKTYSDKYAYQGDKSSSIKVVASVRNLEQLKAAVETSVSEIYYGDIDTFKEAYEMYGDIVTPRLFRITSNDEIAKIKDILQSTIKKGSKVVVGNLGQLNTFKEYDLVVDYSLNTFNQSAVDYYNDLGVSRIVMPYELSKNDIKMISSDELEMIVYGNTPVMVMRYCPITKAVTHCNNCDQMCQNSNKLKDKTGAEFPLVRSGNLMEVLNSKKLHLLEKGNDIKEAGVSVARLEFTRESYEEVKEIIDLYEDVYSGAVSYYDIKESGINKEIESNGFTYGYIFRTLE